jgi:hypothetical protein
MGLPSSSPFNQAYQSFLAQMQPNTGVNETAMAMAQNDMEAPLAQQPSAPPHQSSLTAQVVNFKAIDGENEKEWQGMEEQDDAAMQQQLQQIQQMDTMLKRDDGKSAISPYGHRYVDITEYLSYPQAQAAKKLDIPCSTLSKRWSEAVRGRKWPFRTVARLDKEILTLLHNIPEGNNAQLPEAIEKSLAKLMRKRQEALRPVIIRL